MSGTANRAAEPAVQPKLNYVDARSIPEWGAAPDGRMVKIEGDARLPALFREWQDDACRHPRQAIVQRNDSLGRPQFFGFCPDCGLKLTSAISHAKAGSPSDYTADWMDARNAGYIQEREDRLSKITSAAAERAQSADRASYTDYLRSDAWKRRAAKIHERANGTCEGCLSNPSAEVHHLTYEHIGREFAFELVALCRNCHSRIHENS